MTSAPRLVDRTLLTCFAISFLLFGGVYMLHTLLPGQILRMGGTRFEAGLLFTVATGLSMILRPLVGHWVDRWGTRRVMLPGVAIFIATSLALQLASRPVHLIVLMAGVGVAAGLIATSLVVVVTTSSPADRRGEALSLFYLAQSVAIAMAPAFGFAVADRVGVHVNYALVTIAGALVAALTMSGVHTPGGSDTVEKSPARFFTRHAAIASGAMVLTNVGYGSVYALLPLHAHDAGWASIGWFFTLFSVWLIACRLIFRRVSDRYGRGRVLVPAIVTIALAHFVFIVPPTTATLVAGALLLGAGVSVLYPTMLALVLDRTPPTERGLAIGTLSAAFDLGMALGSAVVGALAQAISYGAGFFVAGIAALGAATVMTISEARRVRAPGARRSSP